MRLRHLTFVLFALAACNRDGRSRGGGPTTSNGPSVDAAGVDDRDGGITLDGATSSLADLASASDAASAVTDAGVADLSPSADLAHAVDAASAADAATTGIITGGPCSSGAAGATAYRVRWAGNGSGSTAYPVYELNGLPDKSRDHVGAYTYQIGGAAKWDDPFLGAGGLVLDSSDFVDIELSTSGINHITSATLAILGRSFATTSSGSFSWQTFHGTGATPTNAVSNSAPYAWYRGDATAAIDAANGGLLLRIKAGPSSGSLIVNRIELCLVAD